MVAHVRRMLPVIAIAAGIALPFVVSSCDKVPLLAPTGTVINLFASSNSASLNSSVTITATAIENGAEVSSGTGATSTTGSTGAGTAVQNGTLISFTTTVGTIQPSEARTHNGQVTVQLMTGAQSGTATITAYSGAASKTLQIKVGTAAASHVQLTASPQSLGSNGGTSTVSALVTDEGGSPVAGIPVTFSTDNGTLSSGTATTDANGVASTTLTTTASATVSVTAGGVSAQTIKVNVGARALSTFSASPQTPTAGQPVTFTVTPASGANISGGTLNFGDGSSQPIGPLGGTFVHTYGSAGSYTATAAVNNATGGAENYTTNISVSSLPVTIQASSSTPAPNTPVTFTASFGGGTPQVDHYVWNYDDGTVNRTTSPSDTHAWSSRGNHVVRVDVFGVDGGLLGTASTTVTVTGS